MTTLQRKVVLIFFGISCFTISLMRTAQALDTREPFSPGPSTLELYYRYSQFRTHTANALLGLGISNVLNPFLSIDWLFAPRSLSGSSLQFGNITNVNCDLIDLDFIPNIETTFRELALGLATEITYPAEKVTPYFQNALSYFPAGGLFTKIDFNLGLAYFVAAQSELFTQASFTRRAEAGLASQAKFVPGGAVGFNTMVTPSSELIMDVGYQSGFHVSIGAVFGI